MTRSLLIAPSILNADFGRLASEIAEADAGGADWLHIDVMDGRYVPNITFGPRVVEAARQVTNLPLDVHLMIEQPEDHIEAFARAGASLITVHVETCVHLQSTLSKIRQLGKRPGVVLNPSTHESAIEYVLDDVDLVLVMSVNPGFGGQKFIPSQLRKVERIAELVQRRQLDIEIQVDGGISTHNAAAVRSAGANVIVAGTAVFGQKDRGAAIAAIRKAAESGSSGA